MLTQGFKQLSKAFSVSKPLDFTDLQAEIEDLIIANQYDVHYVTKLQLIAQVIAQNKSENKISGYTPTVLSVIIQDIDKLKKKSPDRSDELITGLDSIGKVLNGDPGSYDKLIAFEKKIAPSRLLAGLKVLACAVLCAGLATATVFCPALAPLTGWIILVHLGVLPALSLGAIVLNVSGYISLYCSQKSVMSYGQDLAYQKARDEVSKLISDRDDLNPFNKDIKDQAKTFLVEIDNEKRICDHTSNVVGAHKTLHALTNSLKAIKTVLTDNQLDKQIQLYKIQSNSDQVDLLALVATKHPMLAAITCIAGLGFIANSASSAAHFVIGVIAGKIYDPVVSATENKDQSRLNLERSFEGFKRAAHAYFVTPASEQTSEQAPEERMG